MCVCVVWWCVVVCAWWCMVVSGGVWWCLCAGENLPSYCTTAYGSMFMKVVFCLSSFASTAF